MCDLEAALVDSLATQVLEGLAHVEAHAMLQDYLNSALHGLGLLERRAHSLDQAITAYLGHEKNVELLGSSVQARLRRFDTVVKACDGIITLQDLNCEAYQAAFMRHAAALLKGALGVDTSFGSHDAMLGNGTCLRVSLTVLRRWFVVRATSCDAT